MYIYIYIHVYTYIYIYIYIYTYIYSYIFTYIHIYHYQGGIVRVDGCASRRLDRMDRKVGNSQRMVTILIFNQVRDSHI